MQTFDFRRALILLFTATACWGVASTALAQESVAGPDEIVVTATRTGPRSVQDVPLAITAYSAEGLQESGATQLSDVATRTPGFAYSANGPWAISTVRGVGTNNVFVGGDPSTTVQVDGVYYGRPTGANVDFLDVKRLEILRGPQGTLYGRNAVAGTINVITAEPSDEFSGIGRLSVGDYGLVRPEFVLSGPLAGEAVRGSIAARLSRRDGYVEQLTPGVPDQSEEDRWAARGKLLFELGPNADFTLTADHSDVDENMFVYTYRLSPPPADDGTTPGFFEASFDTHDHLTLRQSGVSGVLRWEIGGMTLTSITAYRESFSDLFADLDFTAFPLFTTRTFEEDQNQISQEVTLSGEAGPIEFVTGLFLYREEATSFFNAALFDSLLLTQGVDVTTDSQAVFAQGTYHMSDDLRVTLGLRYTHDGKESSNIFGFAAFAPGGLPANPDEQAPNSEIFRADEDYDELTPRFGLEYDFTPDAMGYLSATRGYKSGGTNLLTDPTTLPQTLYGPETVWAYEGGLKLSFKGGVPGYLNLAAFYYDYTGLQVNQFQFTAGGVGQLVRNAPGARISGVEVEAEIRPADAFTIGGTAAYLDATYDGAWLARNDFTNASFDADGQRLNDAPEWAGSAYAQLDIPLGGFDLSLRAEALYKDDVFYTPLNDPREGSDSYTVVNLGARLISQSGGWEFGVMGRNLTEEEYVTAQFFSLSSGGTVGAPRTVVGYVSFSF